MAKNNIDPIDALVGERLRAARMMRGISQEQLGEMEGITFQQIQKYEKGITRVSASRLAHLAFFLNMPVEWFLKELPSTTMNGKSRDEELSEFDDSIFTSRETHDLIRIYYRIKDRKKRRVVFAAIKSIVEAV